MKDPLSEKESPPPKTRRKFRGPWDELMYLYDKLLYWHYVQDDLRRSEFWANKLARLLPLLPQVDESIKGNECWAMVHEVRQDWKTAVDYRRKEIELIRRLRGLAEEEPAGTRQRMQEHYTISDLADRYDLLAIALSEDGDLHGALSALRVSEDLCLQVGASFEGHDLKEEIFATLNQANGKGKDPTEVA